MHTRKQYLVYPPNYVPGDGYATVYSKFQAYKIAVKMGGRASCYVSIQKFKNKRSNWVSSSLVPLWEIGYVA